MWAYDQATGNTEKDQKPFGVGYSGRDEGKNNPEMQDVKNTGPIPRGKYLIGPLFDHPSKGPFVMRLTAFGSNVMYGRSGFLIHGDSTKHPGKASEGCIILSRPIRLQIAASKDNLLEVV